MTENGLRESVPKAIKSRLKLGKREIGDLLNGLAGDGLVGPGPASVFPTFVITAAGRDRLNELADFVPQLPAKKTVAEQVAETVAAKAAGLGDEPVSASKLGKPGGNTPQPEAVAAFEQAVRELIAEGKLFEHPGGKYGKKAPPTLAEVVRKQVEETLANKAGPFTRTALSKPKKGASDDEKKNHQEALEKVIAELIAAKKLFPHDGGKYGQLPPPPPPDYPDRELREVYTLHQFFRAPGHTITKADIELAIRKGKPDKKTLTAKYPHVAPFRGQGCFEMGAPATRQTLEQLVAAGDLRADERGEAFTPTDAGAKRLEQARAKLPVLPPVGDPATPDDDAMREKWEAVVLLRLTEAADFTAGESAVFAGGYPKGSKLNEATAWVLYGELATAGHVTARWNGTEGEYTLTPKGLRHLAGLSFDEFPEVKVKGRALTALLSAARGGGTVAAPPAVRSDVPPADLEAAVMDIFHRLLRERHANTRMVPIHEVRAAVRAKYGDHAASHAVLDELLLDLRQGKRLRLVPISDPSRVLPDEMRDSIKSSVGTLFYLEAADARPV